MPRLEEAMRDALRRQTPTCDAGEVFERLADRRRRRTMTRKLGTIGLVIAVLGGTVGAFALLGHAFGTKPQPLRAPTASNGALVVSLENEDGFSLYVLPPAKQDLAPAASSAAAGPDMMTRLTSQPGTKDVEPAVSPDGTIVAFVRHARDLADGQGVLSTIGIDGTRENLVTRAPVQAEGPGWSPDGQWIVFSAADEPEGRALYAIRPDGSGLHLAVTGDIPSNAHSPAWSPDGDRIVFSGSAGVAEAADLWLADADGSGARNLTSTPDVAETDPTWSPDGSSIAFATPDGIEQIPADGGTAQVLVPASGVASDRLPGQPAWSPDGRYLAFAFGPTEPLPPVVYVLPVGGTTAFPLSQGWDFAWQPVPANGATPTPSPSVQLDLGLGYDVCRVTSMPINTNGVPGAAYVFTKQGAEGCPAHGDWFVGVDFDNDLVVDATYGPLDDCFIRCEAFAAPDVNADGASEIAVSTEGADGYGVRLFAISASGPSIDPIRVEHPGGIKGFVRPGPLQFAWVDVAGHAESAECAMPNGVRLLVINGIDKVGAKANVRSTVLAVDGSIARVVDSGEQTVPLSDAPIPGHEFCDTPLYNSAANFPNAAGNGLQGESRLCNRQSLPGDLNGDGTGDTVTIGTVRDGSTGCPPDGTQRLVIDLGADGNPDIRRTLLHCSSLCAAFAIADLNGDARAELLLDEGHTAPPASAVVGVYEVSADRLQPILFPDGTNRFPIVNSWQGYFGGYCVPAEKSLTLWVGHTDGGGSLQSVVERTYKLDTSSLHFLKVAEKLTSPATRLPEGGWDGRFCGASALALG